MKLIVSGIKAWISLLVFFIVMGVSLFLLFNFILFILPFLLVMTIFFWLVNFFTKKKKKVKKKKGAGQSYIDADFKIK